jgi:hypothetical protein
MRGLEIVENKNRNIIIQKIRKKSTPERRVQSFVCLENIMPGPFRCCVDKNVVLLNILCTTIQ